MRERNPMREAATVAKMASSLQGRTWLSQRGGRGRLTAPQLVLAKRLALPTEFAIPTRPVAHLFASLPNWYAVDLACPPAMLAIEVDGNTHRTKRWRYLDRRKTEVLEALGWSVLRFWNHEVLTETDRVVAEIRSCITLRSPTTTTTSPAAS